MKTFNEIRIDLVKIAEKMSIVCKAHNDCETCPLHIAEYKPNGWPFEYNCASKLLDYDLDFYFDNINDIVEILRKAKNFYIDISYDISHYFLIEEE